MDYEARNKLVEENIGLVSYVTRMYYYIPEFSRGELDSYGYEGLIKAAEMFNPEYGYSFSTFAISYIKSYVRDGMAYMFGFFDNSRFYRLFIKYKNQLEIYYSEGMDKRVNITMDLDMIDKILDMMLKEEYLKYSASFIKNKYKIYDVFHYSYEEMTFLEYDYDMDKKFFIEYLKEITPVMFEVLSDREKEVLRYRFGFDGTKVLSFEEIGKLYGMTKQGIKAIENGAIRKIRRLDVIKNIY